MLLFFASAVYVANTKANDNTCRLNVGWGDWPPYQTLSSAGPEGVQINLIKAIADEAGCQLEFTLQTFTENQKSVRNGTVDMTLDTTITAERQQYAYFSAPYRNEVLALYVRPKYVKPCQSESVAELIEGGLRLGMTRENYYGETIAKLQSIPQINNKIIYRDKNSEHFQLFIENKIDAFIEDPLVMAYKMRNDDKIGRLKSCKVAVSSSPVSLMFSKKTVSPQLVNRINAALEKIKKTKWYQQQWQW